MLSYIRRFPNGVNETKICAFVVREGLEDGSEMYHDALFEMVLEGTLSWKLPEKLGQERGRPHDGLSAPLVYKVVGE